MTPDAPGSLVQLVAEGLERRELGFPEHHKELLHQNEKGWSHRKQGPSWTWLNRKVAKPQVSGANCLFHLCRQMQKWILLQGKRTGERENQ